MHVSIFVGDIAEAPAEAICTSTNPRLSLMMGTAARVREKGGWDVMRACESIVAQEGGPLRAGSVHPTTPGAMKCKALLHCVASNQSHMTSAGIIQACVKNALAHAERLDCRSIAMPIFGTGHARFKFDQALLAMREALQSASARVDEVVIVVFDPARAADAAKIMECRG